MFTIVSIDFLIVLIIISLLTIVQSLFGIGILVFGTPTLLLLGYEFTEVLSYLLPPSIVISFCQFFPNTRYIELYKFNVFFYLLPMVIFGLLTVIYLSEFNLMLFVGLILLFTFTSRFSLTLAHFLNNFLSKNFKFGLMVTGFIHGLSNLGGAPLLAITNGIYDNKKEIQVNMAYAYFTMATVQLVLLCVMNVFTYGFGTILFPLTAFFIFWFFGNKVFVWATEIFYYNALTFFILCYAFLLIFNSI